ncbi:WYL domain-containing protein [Myxococcus sp. MISCRS1]|jgi:proteasome accessory factor B|uniref:helix-turn-helix transcriptional regulator n=1 Tax=Myxococcus TaxID=32 RepID=UPI001CBF68BA|nr:MULTISPECIES: WYL domain-containing protein [unclassified Myxococcus]MBZ4400298.1 WYL domain-containing protein [Myxococcus sp. AS-1-15]MBZ4407996.1 WYL domain-containing protein [Myxococcus sp. XM-1-1-1]MCY0998082.1 WYL domain-containing protein [Myxococcus sp. MISCRS1]BDT31856.1 WYL domain-containing protein [Myxococcus sp. MH1]
MDRTERILDLVALLLDAREPISWAELREHFPADYGGSDDAAERKFERDKAELVELGFPLTYVQGDDERRDGYIVDRDAYYLPEADLTKEELAVLYAAGSAALTSGAFPGRDDLAHALRKIGFFAGQSLPTPRVRMELGAVQEGQEKEISARLEQLWDACAARKWVEISYASPKHPHATQRRVDPYGLALRRGVWTLVGHCQLRGGLRTFHVHRVRELKVNTARPRTPDFQVPEDFSLDNHVAYFPWQHRFHEPQEVVLRLSGALASRASGLFPGAVLEQVAEGGITRAHLKVSFLDGLVRFCLSLGADCVVEGPESACARLREMAARVANRHADAQEDKVSA